MQRAPISPAAYFERTNVGLGCQRHLTASDDYGVPPRPGPRRRLMISTRNA